MERSLILAQRAMAASDALPHYEGEARKQGWGSRRMGGGRKAAPLFRIIEEVGREEETPSHY